jgi:pSer/pThr/pTyr-binding forkhead associated (FHA) protein
VSKLHCAVAAWAGLVRVRDLKSRNGTFLNGQPIHGEVPVRDGDQLQVGTLTFAFSIKNKDGTSITYPIREHEVEWLLQSTDDSGVLASSEPTCAIPVLGDEPCAAKDQVASSATDTSAPPTRKRKSKVVSAGKNFRDYFEMRKSPPSAG